MDWFKIRSWLGAKLLISFQSCNSFGQINEINTHVKKSESFHGHRHTQAPSCTLVLGRMFPTALSPNWPENVRSAFWAISPWASQRAGGDTEPFEELGGGSSPQQHSGLLFRDHFPSTWALEGRRLLCYGWYVLTYRPGSELGNVIPWQS